MREVFFSRSDLLSNNMRKRIIPLILRCLIHLEKITLPVHISTSSRTSRSISSSRRSNSSGAGGGRSTARNNTTTVVDRRAALPADAATFKDLFTTIEQHVQFRIADDTTFAIGRVLHDFDMLAFQSEQLSRHLCYGLSRLAGFGIATDWYLEFA